MFDVARLYRQSQIDINMSPIQPIHKTYTVSGSFAQINCYHIVPKGYVDILNQFVFEMFPGTGLNYTNALLEFMSNEGTGIADLYYAWAPGGADQKYMNYIIAEHVVPETMQVHLVANFSAATQVNRAQLFVHGVRIPRGCVELWG